MRKKFKGDTVYTIWWEKDGKRYEENVLATKEKPIVFHLVIIPDDAERRGFNELK